MGGSVDLAKRAFHTRLQSFRAKSCARAHWCERFLPDPMRGGDRDENIGPEALNRLQEKSDA
jgi:hypothetical protein